MKNRKRTKHPISMTMYQPVLDVSPGGYADFISNLGSVLTGLAEKNRLFFRTQKVRVKVSKIGFLPNDKERSDPFRYILERVYTVGYLLDRYEYIKGTPFNVEKFEESQLLERRALEVRGEGRAAWGLYSHIQEMQKNQKDQTEQSEQVSPRSYKMRIG